MDPKVLLVDKPTGVTSHDVVSRIRRELPRGVRVGHAGTLDPFATGLLIILVGRATRAQRYFMGLDKEYVSVARFGATSDTLDRDGIITPTGRYPDADLSLPTGTLTQTPPKYSALHVDGKRAHQLARDGVDFELPSREVQVHSFDELERSEDLRTFRIRCGSGTYIRSLIAELGDAYCEELRRVAIGPFRVPDQLSDGEPNEISLEIALTQILPTVELNQDDATALGHGRPVRCEQVEEGPVVAIGPTGLVAIATTNDAGMLASSVGFVG